MKTAVFVLSLSSAAAGQVTGSVSYEDRIYTNTGFTGATVQRPVRQAEVQLVRASDNAILSTGNTDNTGAFSFAGVSVGQTVFARVYARRAGGQINAVVKNNPSVGATYAAITSSITTTGGLDGVPPLALTIAGGAAPAFNIFDCAVKTFQYLAQPTIEPGLAAVPPLLTLYWESGATNGTYFDRPTSSVFLLGQSSDPDEYDDDIILHEIGHWVAFTFSKDDTLGGPHSVIDQLDPRTSWSEGWAHYWSAAVRRLFPAEYPTPWTLVDNFGSGASFFDIELPSFPSLAVMATNELAVAAVLWDITDAANEPPFDTLTGYETEVWRSFRVRIPARTQITLEDFREGLSLEAPAIMPAVTGSETGPGIMKDRRIRYYPDGSEPNNSAAAAAPLPLGLTGLTQRTIFGIGDEDWYSVALTPGTLVAETLNLGDSADTRLELYDTNGTTLLAWNDDRSATDKSSLLQVSIATAGTYFLRVVPSGGVVENGYYDIRAQIVLNVPPVVSSVSASATSGTAPLRVTLSAVASDFERGYLDYQWDFDGNGRFDWSSLRGPTVTTTYARAGTYAATFRVVDGAGATSPTGSVTITVLPAAAPTIRLTQDSMGGVAPWTVNFDAQPTGVVPAAYAWDFEGDGVTDRVSIVTPAASFTYRKPGSFTAWLTVHDSQGRAYRVFSSPVTVTPGAAPPSVASFTATNGALPFSTALAASHSTVSKVEFDLDGDGAYDLEVPPTAPGSTTVIQAIQRVGIFSPRVRVTDASGLTGEMTTSFTATVSGTSGWLVDPVDGDRLAGDSVTLTAEAVPAGPMKKVQFQYRDHSPPGPWNDIGGPISSQGTLIATSWDVARVATSSSLDLRILIDDTFSSGDAANVVTIDAASPTVSESGGIRDRVVRPTRRTVSRNAAGVWVIMPNGAMTATSDQTLRIEPVSAPPANGSALTFVQRGAAYRVSVNSGFANTFRLRLPFAGDGALLDIHGFDEASGFWHRVFFSRVSHEDGWVEADVNASGVYALFGPPAEALSSGGNGGGSCLSSVPPPAASPWTGWIALLALGWVAWPRRR